MTRKGKEKPAAKPKQFETTFGEVMKDLGVKSLAPPAPRRPAAAAAPGRPIDPRDERLSEDAQPLLDAVAELQAQRNQLQQQIARQEKQLLQAHEENSALRARLQQQTEARQKDLAQLAALRQQHADLQRQHDEIRAHRESLQRALAARAAPPAPPGDPDPEGDPQAEEEAVTDGTSDLAQAAARFAARCAARGVTRVVIVGGSPAYHQQLSTLFPRNLELRLVSGADRRSRQQAQHDLEWAHRVILWGGTILDHGVSQLYRGPTVLPISHRGLVGMLRLAEQAL